MYIPLLLFIQCVYLVNIPEPVQYKIYALALSFDLRCESGTLLPPKYHMDNCDLCVVPKYHLKLATHLQFDSILVG